MKEFLVRIVLLGIAVVVIYFLASWFTSPGVDNHGPDEINCTMGGDCF